LFANDPAFSSSRTCFTAVRPSITVYQLDFHVW
jgi:hypothetical protein